MLMRVILNKLKHDKAECTVEHFILYILGHSFVFNEILSLSERILLLMTNEAN